MKVRSFAGNRTVCRWFGRYLLLGTVTFLLPDSLTSADSYLPSAKKGSSVSSGQPDEPGGVGGPDRSSGSRGIPTGTSGGVGLDDRAPNDDFANALHLPSHDQIRVKIADQRASEQPGEPEELFSSLWWKWKAPRAGRVALIASSVGLDTRSYVGVYRGSAGSGLDLVAFGRERHLVPESTDPSFEDGGMEHDVAPAAAFDAERDVTYHLVVNGESADGTPGPPGVQGFWLGFYNDDFEDRQQITGDQVRIETSTAAATREDHEPQHGLFFNPAAMSQGSASSEHTLWWTWTAARDGSLEVSLDARAYARVGARAHATLAVHEGGALQDLWKLAATDMERSGRLRLNAHRGESYHIVVSHVSFRGELDNMEYFQPAGPGPVLLELNLSDPPRNDLFENRARIPGSQFTVSGTNLGASHETGEPGHHPDSAGASVWWEWTASRTETVMISTLGSQFNTILAVYEQADQRRPVSVTNLRLAAPDAVNALDPSLDAAVEDENPYLNRTSRVRFQAQAGRTYYFAVDGYRDDGRVNDPHAGPVLLGIKRVAIESFELTYRDDGGDFQNDAFEGVLSFRNYTPWPSQRLRVRLEARADTVSWQDSFTGESRFQGVEFRVDNEDGLDFEIGALGPGERRGLGIHALIPDEVVVEEGEAGMGRAAKIWGVAAVLEMQAAPNSSDWTPIDSLPLVYSRIPSISPPTPWEGPNGGPIRTDANLEAATLPNLYQVPFERRSGFSMELDAALIGGEVQLTTFKVPIHGTIELVPSGRPEEVVYEVNDEVPIGTHDRFVIQIDGTDPPERATVWLELADRSRHPNNAPRANGQDLETDAGVALPITLTGTDLDFDRLAFEVLSGPTHGELSGTVPNLLYTPRPGYDGEDRITFKARDQEADSEPATISITVRPVGPLEPTRIEPVFSVVDRTLVLKVTLDARQVYDLERTDDFQVWTVVPGVDWQEAGSQKIVVDVGSDAQVFFRLVARRR